MNRTVWAGVLELVASALVKAKCVPCGLPVIAGNRSTELSVTMRQVTAFAPPMMAAVTGVA